jgi:antitoxin MazE
MKARLVRIGNSRGVRLPKPLLVEAELEEEVDIQARRGAIIITSRKIRRAGWAEAAKLAHAREDDRLVAPLLPTHFDANEWQW